MKISLNFQIKNLSGDEISGEMGNGDKILANLLSQTNKGNSIKLYDWALKLWNHQELELDDTDMDVLIGLVETSESLFVIAKAPIITHLKKIKDGK